MDNDSLKILLTAKDIFAANVQDDFGQHILDDFDSAINCIDTMVNINEETNIAISEINTTLTDSREQGQTIAERFDLL